VAGALTQARAVLKGASSTSRSVVCISLNGVGDGANLCGAYDKKAAQRGVQIAIQSAASGERYGLHSSLVEVAQLFNAGSLAFLSGLLPMSPTGGGRDYLQDGYCLPAWMMRAAGATMLEPLGKAVVMPSSAVMLCRDGVTAPKSGVGSKSTLGGQLSEIADVLASQGSRGSLFVATLGGTSVVGDAERQRAARYRDLSDNLAAFYSALASMGLLRNVTVYADAGLGDHSGTGGAASQTQIVMGGDVLGREVYTGITGGRDGITAALADWAGYSAGVLFPGVQLPGSPRFLV
jgi:hypothetical protein